MYDGFPALGRQYLYGRSLQDDLPEASHKSQDSLDSGSLPAAGSPQRDAEEVAGIDGGSVLEMVSDQGQASGEEESHLGKGSEEDAEANQSSEEEQNDEGVSEELDQKPDQQSLQQQQPEEGGRPPGAEQAAAPQASPSPRRRNQRFSNAQSDSLEAAYQSECWLLRGRS